MNAVQKDGRDPEVAKNDLETVKRIAAVLGEITEKSHHLISQYLENTEEDDGFRIMHPAIISKAFQDMAQKEPDWANIFGGADKALPFEAYYQYSAMMALKSAMIAAKFGEE